MCCIAKHREIKNQQTCVKRLHAALATWWLST